MANQDISAALKKQIDAIRKPFAAFVVAFGKLDVDRRELAPSFMKAYGGYLQQTGGSFVDFARLLDPTIPAERASYKANKAYMAADYLRRLVSRRDTGTRRAKPMRSNLSGMARLLATLMPLIKDQESAWSGIAAELGLTQRQIGRLRTESGSAKPLLELRGVKPVAAKIIHVPTLEEVTTQQRKAA